MSGFTITRRTALGFSLVGASALAWPRLAFAAQETEVDAIVAAHMAAFDTPGVAVAIVRPDAPPFVKGYGVRTLGLREPVDAHTRFGIASNTKSFTAAALALLVDEGKLGWEDPVRRHLPEFRMAEETTTALMTVRDLLVHRSGLPLGAGDLMAFPASDRPASDVLKALPFLKPTRGFRTGYDYDNILYTVAGLVIERVAGMRWSDFIAARLLGPVGMTDAVPAQRFLKTGNVAGRHARLGPPVRGMGTMAVVQPDEGPMIDAAGGINASATDLARWLQVQLGGGTLADGRRLWSAEQAAEMWKPQTIVASGDGASAEWPAAGITQTYALGWFVQDYRGQRLVHHSGGLSGQVTQTAMLPARKLGVVVLTNVEDGVSAGIRNAILDHLIGAPAFDWPAALLARRKKGDAEALAVLGPDADQAPAGGPSLPIAAYAGRYRDPWYGDVVVVRRGAGLAIDFVPTPLFKSALEPWGRDAFRTRFPKGAGEDAVVTFATAGGKVTGVTMKALSPLADFSYDFHDLAFVPVP